LSDTICHYETECEAVLDISEDDYKPIPEKYQNLFYDKNTTLLQYLYAIRITIFDYLQHIRRLWNNKQVEEIAAELKLAHDSDFSMLFNAKKRVENDFSLIENLTMETIESSLNAQEKESIKKSLEEMRNNLKQSGFDI
jgi:hypothetical protein